MIFIGKTLADYECCVCGKRKTAKGGSGYEPIEKCQTENGARCLHAAALSLDFPHLHAEVAGSEWQAILAREYFYHRSCYKEISKKRKPVVSSDAESVFNELIAFIEEKVITGCEVLRMVDLSQIYAEIADRLFGEEHQIGMPKLQRLKEKIKKQLGSKIAFWTPKYGSDYVFNNGIEKGQLVEVAVKAKLANSRWDEKSLEEKTADVAREIRNELRETPNTFSSWPPPEQELLSQKTEIPNLTACLLEGILRKKPTKSHKLSRLVSSIGQDLIYHANNGRKKTSKHATLSFCIKRKTGSKIVINWTNKFGHGVSYDDVLILETSLAMEHSKDQIHRCFFPAIIQPSHFVTFIWDNNDINPESIKGLSLHCTNGIIAQSTTAAQNDHISVPFEHAAPVQSPIKQRAKKFQPLQLEIAPYIQVKRKNTDGPTTIQLSTIQEETERSRKVDTMWIITRCQAYQRDLEQQIPSWTGFNYLMCDHDCQSHQIGYLPSINQSPTSMDTVLELLSQSKIKAEKLGLAETDVVLDMAIYAKAVEIMMNPRYIDLKKFIVLRLGGFHTMCIFIAVIGKRFADAGLRDIAIEANLLGESSVDQMLKGKHYNNAMRILKYLYEALRRHMLESFEQWQSDQPDHHLGYDQLVNSSEIKRFVSSPTRESLEEVYEHHNEVVEEIHAYEDSLLGGLYGPTASIWCSFLQMVQILLDFARSVKIGDWKLHLQSTKNMLPWMFSYDRPNYARFLTYYLVAMKKLPETHPAIQREFEAGHFSVRRQPGRFNKIPSDQAIEQTINREQKCAGGIVGYSTSEGTVQRWVLTSHVAAKCQSEMEEFLGMSEAQCITKDLGRKRVLHDEECVARSYELIKEWGTPFKENSFLIHLSSGLQCGPDIEEDMVNAEKKGKEAMDTFLAKRIESNQDDLYAPIQKMKLKTFAAMKVKKSCKVKDRSITLKADRDVFARLLVICGKRDVKLKEVLTYSLGPIPWSLATADGSFVKSVKSKLLDAIEKEVDNPVLDALPLDCVRVFDGMVMIQQLESASLSTFGEMSEYALKRITSHPGGKIVYFVTDQYLDDSLKGNERRRRAASGTIRIQLSRREQKRPKQFKKFLSDGVNKVDLVKFFLNDWSDPERFKAVIAEKVIFVTVESECHRIEVVDNMVISRREVSLCSNQEEADTKMFLCCQHASQFHDGETNVCISTVDSDVVVLAAYYKERISCNMYVEIGSKTKKRILAMSKIHEVLGEKMCSALPSLHALTGCDSTSAFFGIGKQKAYKVVKGSIRYQEVLAGMGEAFQFDENVFSIIEEMVAEFYGVKSCPSINDARYRKFCTKNHVPEPQKLPPTKDELFLHCLRANYVARIWKLALVPNVLPPSPEGHGWLLKNGILETKWMSQRPAPDSLLEFLSCGCKKSGCQNNMCVCIANGLKCTDLCSCNTCTNSPLDEDDDNGSETGNSDTEE